MRAVGVLLGVACLGTAARPAAAADLVRYAFIVGNNRGAPSSTPLKYAEADAEKMREILTRVGGFSASNTVLHRGATAASVSKSLWSLEQGIAAAKRAGARSLLVLYYSGHANAQALELGDTPLPFSELKRFLRTSRADLRVAIIDSCRSGRLVATKGARAGPPFEIRLSDQMASEGYAVISSSTADELSQESAEIRGSTFTHHFVSALRGAGDDSGDRRVTLNEAYRYAYLRTVAQTAADLGGGQHPMYDFKLSGKGDIVLTSLASYPSGLSFAPHRTGRLIVVSRDQSSAVGECPVQQGRPIRLALAPDTYWVYLVGSSGVERAELSVQGPRTTELSPLQFKRYRPARHLEKGGLFRVPPLYQGGAFFLLRQGPLAGVDLSYGCSLVYGVQLASHLEPSITVSGAWARDAGLSTGYYELGVYPGLAYVWPLSRLTLLVEGRVGYEFMGQRALAGQPRYTSGLGYQGGAGVRFPVAGPLWAKLGAAAGGRVLRLREEGWSHQFDWQVTSGLLWVWRSR